MQEFTAPLNTNYKIECWGAQGGNYNNSLGGKGGYSIGYKSLGASNNLYVCVGSKGSSNSGNTGGNGGYNGGGNGGNGFDFYSGAGGGGGATHIAITSDRGELKNYKNYQQELLLVAGGGGGSCGRNSGVGGGLNGGNAINNNTYTLSGATQNTGYAFGQGQDGKSKTVYGDYGAEGNGGGGGGFYGGYASQEQGEGSNCGGAGGSGYVGDVTNGATIAGNQVFPGTSGATETGHSGDGYAIITWQQLP